MDYKLMAGLGNPGPEYEATRHNAGFLALDLLADELGARYWKNESGALVAHVQHGGEELLLVKPQAYMNTSGGPISKLAAAYKIAPAELLVIHDDARLKGWIKIVLTFVICAITFPSDWSCVAAMAILFMGQARGDFRRQMCWLMVWSAVYALVYFFFIDKIYALVQLGTALSIPLLRCYDGTRGKWRSMGRLFYVYYPAHLALIGVLRVLLWGAGASTAAGSF
mgnify:CR=1 FL=1